MLRTPIIFGGRVLAKSGGPRAGRPAAAESKKAIAAAKKNANNTKAHQRQRENAAEKLFLRRIQEARSRRQRIIRAALRRALAGESRDELKDLQRYDANKELAVAELVRLKKDLEAATAAPDAAGEAVAATPSRRRCCSKTPKRQRRVETASEITARKREEREAERRFEELVAGLKTKRKAELLAAQEAEASHAAQAEAAKAEILEEAPVVKMDTREQDEREAERRFEELVAGLKTKRQAELLAAQEAEAAKAEIAEATRHENAEQGGERHFKEMVTDSKAERHAELLASQELRDSTSFSTRIVDEETSPDTLEGDASLTAREVDSVESSGEQEKEERAKLRRSARHAEKAAARIRHVAATLQEPVRNVPEMDMPQETAYATTATTANSTPTPAQEVPYTSPARPVISDVYRQSTMVPPAVHALPLAGFNEPPLVSQFRAPNEMTHQWRSMTWPTSVDAPVVSLRPQMMQAHHSPLGRIQAVPSAFPRGASVPQHNRERQNRGSGLFRL